MSDREYRRSLSAFATGCILLGLIIAGMVLSGCTAACKAEEQPALQDALAVLLCAANGTPLATCEEQQLAAQAGNLAPGALFCGESLIAKAASGSHAAVDAGAK